MEQELVLHSFQARAVEPEAVLARCWAALGQLPRFREETSEHRSCGLGALPLIRYGRFFFAHGHILNFFKLAFDFDFDLSPEERKESELLAELCVSRLHPATVYAMWMDASTSKDFFAPSQPWPLSWLTSPFLKLRFLWEKAQVKSYLERQHRVLSAQDAFRLADDVHSRLSARLGTAKFFNSAADRRDYPRSLDIVVYSYLLEELANLPEHAHIKESFDKYPNLRLFLARMEQVLSRMGSTIQDIRYYDFFYVKPPGEDEESYRPPALRFNEKLYHSGYFEPERLKQEEAPALPFKPKHVPASAIREGYLVGTGLILLIFLHFRK